VSTFEDIFRNYGNQMGDFLRANKLYHLLIAHAHDGTEAYRVVDQELRGLENQSAAVKIKRALLQQYRGTIPIHAAVELVMVALKKGQLE